MSYNKFGAGVAGAVMVASAVAIAASVAIAGTAAAVAAAAFAVTAGIAVSGVVASIVGDLVKDATAETKKAFKGLVFGSTLGASLAAGLFSYMGFSGMQAEKIKHQDFINNHLSYEITPAMRAAGVDQLKIKGGEFLLTFTQNANAETAAKKRAAYDNCIANADDFKAAGVDCNTLAAPEP